MDSLCNTPGAAGGGQLAALRPFDELRAGRLRSGKAAPTDSDVLSLDFAVNALRGYLLSLVLYVPTMNEYE
jgi:hypothetical protein